MITVVHLATSRSERIVVLAESGATVGSSLARHGCGGLSLAAADADFPDDLLRLHASGGRSGASRCARW